MSISERLKKARESAGLSQKQAAKLLGISHSAISHYESESRRITIEMLKCFAEIYDVSEVWLFSGVSDMAASEINEIARLLEHLPSEDFDKMIDLLTMLRQAKGGTP